MKYKKNKLRLNEIFLGMRGFHFLVKFGLVLISILKVYSKKSSSILLRKYMFNSLLAFFFWKACTVSCFERFLSWKSRNYSLHFSLENFLWDLFILCYHIIPSVWFVFYPYFLFSPSFFLFLSDRYFPWQTRTIHRIAGKGEEIIIFLFFNLHPLTNFHLVHWDFYHFFYSN